MAKDINRTFLIGRLTADPELSYTGKTGTAICKFSLANNDTYGSGTDKKDYVSFFSCVAWGKLAEVITEYCKKGHRVAVEGRLRQERWDDNNGGKHSRVDLHIENCEFLNTKKENGEQ